MSYFYDHRFFFLYIFILSLFGLSFTACAGPQSALDSRLHVRMSENNHPSGDLTKKEPVAPDKQADEISVEKTEYKILEPLREEPPEKIKTRDMRYPFNDTPSITVAVDNLPLPDFVHYVFGDLLKVNYVLSSKVSAKDTVSLSLDEQVSPLDLFRTVTDMLSEYHLAVQEQSGIFHIVPVKKNSSPAALGWGKNSSDIPSTPGDVRQVVPLQYVDAQEMISLIGRVPGVHLFRFGKENAVIVIGPGDGVAQVLEYISVFDQPAMRGKFGAMFKLKFWNPDGLVPKLKEILSVEGVPVAQSAGQSGVQLITLDRWRMMLVFAAEKAWIKRVRYWIELLDIPEETTDQQYFIFFPENSRALDLMETLQSIMGISKDTPEQNSSSSTFQPASGLSETGSKKSAAISRKPAVTQITGGTGLDAGACFAVDEVRNALIVYTDPVQYKKIEELLTQLDILPPQVLIEATVAEVTLSDDLQFGLEWYLKNTDGSQTTVISTQGGLGLGSAGLSLSMVADSDKFRVLVDALAEKNMVEILSSPHVTVRDGKTASITVGTQVPVVTSEVATAESADTNGTGVVRAYQYRSTGVSLHVTPTVHARNVVTLEIEQEVSEASASGGENPTILERSVSTDVVATSGQTLVIGGLIKENNSNRISSVPFFGDLPLLGYLFKTTGQGQERTELVIMITPHIIRSKMEIDDIRQELFKNFKHIETGGI